MEARLTIVTPHGEITYRNSDVVNPEDYVKTGDFNPHNVRPWLIHNEFGTLAIVYADCEQNAIDAAVDADKMDSCLISPADEQDFIDKEGNEDFARLGNAGEPFDLTYIGLVELPNAQYANSIPREDVLKGGPGLDGYAYNADVYCVDCGQNIIREQWDGGEYADGGSGDSDEHPQPIFFGESDTPEHCTECGAHIYGPEEEGEEA